MSLKSSIRRAVRTAVYQSPLHRWLRPRGETLDGAAWNDKLSGEWSPYLDDTISIATRNALIAMLIDRHDPEARVLDIGCGRGSLCGCLNVRPDRYVGMDISQVAIETARRINPDAEFHTSPLEAFEPKGAFDAIVFSEVMYYMSVPDAETQAQRYSRFLSWDGIDGAHPAFLIAVLSHASR